MATHRMQAHRCPICGNEFAFTALAATISAVHYHQTRPNTWKKTSVEAKRYNARSVLAFVCESCGHPYSVPRAIFDEVAAERNKPQRPRARIKGRRNEW